MRKAMAFFFVGVQILGACGDSTSGPGLDEVADKYAEAYCDFMERCEHLPNFRGTYLNERSCTAYMRRVVGEVFIGYYVDQAKLGRISYDAGRAAECLDAVASSCDREPEACHDVFTGTQPNGSSCRANEECASGWCDLSDACPGVCAEPAREGESCDERDCAYGLRCQDDVCRPEPPPAKLGEDCSEVDCEPGLYCSSDETCQEKKGQDAACEEDEECEPSLLCIQATCRKPVLITQEGEPCNPDEGRLCDMDSGLACAFVAGGDRTCQKMKAEGDKCLDVAAGTFVLCDFSKGLYCDGDLDDPTRDGFCRAPKEDGQPCDRDEGCVSLNCQDGTCRPYDPCAD